MPGASRRGADNFIANHPWTLAEAVDHDCSNYDFATWQEMSQLKREFEPDKYDWIHTVKQTIVVPRIIRLLMFGKVRPAAVRFSRRNIFARDDHRCQYCGRKYPSANCRSGCC